MKKILFCIFLAIVFMTCGKTDDTKRLKSYLCSWGYDIREFKVICFIPVDGCTSCIDPFLEYSKISRENYLLVLNSIYKKSVEYTIGIKGLAGTRILSDTKNYGTNYGLVDAIYPRVYFVENGDVVKMVNASTIPDKADLFDEMNEALDNGNENALNQ